MTTPSAPTSRFRPAAVWAVRGGAISLARSVVMGIVNVTPDSFSDGGRFLDVDAAVAHATALVEEGADIIDIGGESTRPGSASVDGAEQIRRVIPVIGRIASLNVHVSVDTTRADVARSALDAGATIVNDVSGGLDDPELLSVVAASGAGLVLMHRPLPSHADRYSDRHDTPPVYADIVRDVVTALRDRRDAAIRVGVADDAIALDPGLGFGKDVAQNLRLMARVDALVQMHPIILIGASRKSFVGAACAVADGPSIAPEDRLAGSLAAAVLCRLGGAAIVRVHDVAETRQALALTDAVAAHTDPD